MSNSSPRSERAQVHTGDSTPDVSLEINRYLFHELELAGDEDRVSECWPFSLREVCSSGSAESNTRVFEFSYNSDTYFVQAGPPFSFWIADGMSLEELRLCLEGERWLAAHHAVDLDTETADAKVLPSAASRRQSIEQIAWEKLSNVQRLRVLEGLYLPSQNCYLALVEDLDAGCGFLIGSNLAPQRLKRSEAAPWRRLAVAVGGWYVRVSCGDLG